jgi:L-ornithine N5-oxygenase
MSQASLLDETEEVPVYDLVGIGFGPSNLALAIAITEHNEKVTRARDEFTREIPGDRRAVLGGGVTTAGVTTAVFLESQPRFGWHRGMLLDDATMQVSFLKDLVTLRNPTSEFSFLCYLQERGRLCDFINHKSLFPLRVEFHDYLEWAAAKVDDLVSYGHEVVDVTPVREAGVIIYFDVTARTDRGVSKYRARNLVFATGLRPHLPEGITASDRIWHTRDLLNKVDDITVTPNCRFIVVGAGQSAAEVTAFLHRRFADAEVCAVFSRYGYSPADDSSFANRIFDPAAVGEFFDAPESVKKLMLDYHGNTNYSVVDGELIEELYRCVYQEKVLGTQRLRLFNVSRPADVIDGPDGVRMTIQSLISGEQTTLDADVVVYATGYRPADPFQLLGEAARYCESDGIGRPVVERDYRVRTSPELRCGIYLQGGTEHTHGITSSLLSNTAVRAGEILESILRPAELHLPEREYTGSGIPV